MFQRRRDTYTKTKGIHIFGAGKGFWHTDSEPECHDKEKRFRKDDTSLKTRIPQVAIIQ